MGYNTVVFLLNDTLHETLRTQRDLFCEQVLQIASGGRVEYDRYGRREGQVGRFPSDSLVGQSTVVSVAHASEMQVILAGGNRATLLGTAYGCDGPNSREQVKRALNQVLEQYGMKVIEARKSKEE